LILPPSHGGTEVDPLERGVVSSLVHDISLTLCRSRRYEVVAPFTARQIAGGFAAPATIGADYEVHMGLAPRPTPQSYSMLSLEVRRTASAESIYRDEIELRSGLLLDLHFALCGIVTDKICGQIARQELLQFRRTGAASAYVHYLLATERNERTDLASLRRAQKHLLRSWQLSPDYVPALAELARTKTLEWLELGVPDRTLLLEARHLAERAQLYEPADSASLREIGHASLYLHDLDTALASYEAAEVAAPNHADLLADQADVLTHASRHDEAEVRIARALALNPLAPDDYYWIGGAVSFFRGRYGEALARLSGMRTPGLAYRLMAASAAMTNDAERAAQYRQRALERDPTFSVDKWTSLYPTPSNADTQHYSRALRLAGFN
jgi:tetratricopeptide (TPR) repeat protein